MNFSILRTHEELGQWREEQRAEIILVPTMGCLHSGHSRLIEVARTCEFNKKELVVLVSIFVNPLQFGPDEDFKTYPRGLEKDIELATAFGANALWAPSTDQIFPKGPKSHFQIQVPKSLTSYLCGQSRAGHFDGVATVVLRLLTLVKPRMLVLGEKDWQQLVILRALLKDLDLAIKIKSVATVRDKDGLACSSRNQYLDASERLMAQSLPKELSNAVASYKNQKGINIPTIKSSLEQNGLKVDYVELLDPQFLQPIKQNKNLALLAAAVRCGSTRLIDHTFLMTRNPIVAIDGPAGAGKSTVTRELAKKLGLLYLDTGAMYRSVAWILKENEIDPQNEEAVKKILKTFDLELKQAHDKSIKVIVNGNNISNSIRSPDITALVSFVAAQKVVRDFLTTQQQKIGLKGGLVAEGRDIGTAVFPDAELKVFLTASTGERARRRVLDLKNQGFFKSEINEVEAQIKERDRLDSTRSISPLVKADDAIELITDGMNINNVVIAIEDLFRERIPEEVWPTPG